MGRTKLTDRNKLINKLERLQKEIERIRILLSGHLDGDTEYVKIKVLSAGDDGKSSPSACKGPDRTTEVLTIDETNPEDIDRRDGIQIDKEE